MRATVDEKRRHCGTTNENEKVSRVDGTDESDSIRRLKYLLWEQHKLEEGARLQVECAVTAASVRLT
jgi:hypothetical protein